MSEPDAWMSSDPTRANQLMSAAQYKSALPKNRECFDVALYRRPVEITDEMVQAGLAAYATHMKPGGRTPWDGMRVGLEAALARHAEKEAGDE